MNTWCKPVARWTRRLDPVVVRALAGDRVAIDGEAKSDRRVRDREILKEEARC